MTPRARPICRVQSSTERVDADVRRRFGEAEQEFAIARELDPLDPMLRVHHALVAFYRRDFDAAVEALRRVLEMEPQNLVARVLSASAHLGLRRVDEALALFERIAADVPGGFDRPARCRAGACAGRAHGRSARRIRRDARALRRGARRSLPDGDRFQPARRCGFCVRVARARRAARDLNLVCLAVDPSFDALRDDPRWQPALARYGLPVIDPRAAAR